MSAVRTPRTAVLELDGFSWRLAAPPDAVAMEALAGLSGNRELFDLPRSEDEFAARMGRPGFRRVMICHSGLKPIGAAAITQRSRDHLNVRLMCFLEQPAEAALAAAIYVGHLFWSLPLHRIYVQLPLVDGAAAYRRLFAGIGFQEEGVVPVYGMVGGELVDVAVLGQLRSEFDAWCQRNESRLAL